MLKGLMKFLDEDLETEEDIDKDLVDDLDAEGYDEDLDKVQDKDLADESNFDEEE